MRTYRARLDERSPLRRQARAAVKTLLRPATYTGAAREIALTGVHAALYPLGMGAQPRADPGEPGPEAPAHPALRDNPETADIPVVLVHGYVHNRSAFVVLSRQLRRAGFRYVHGLNYNPLRYDIPEIAEMLAVEVDRVRDVAGAQRVMLVGHSMGGIVARYYTQELAAPDSVDTVITLASPHRGTYTTYLAPGPAGRDLRPGSAVIRRLKEGARPSATRWIAYWSDLDFFVTPAVHAKLVHPALAATNRRLRNTGHLSVLLSREVTSGVVDQLAQRPPIEERTRPAPRPLRADASLQQELGHGGGPGRLRLIEGGSSADSA